jgi:hypothetical protein
MPKGRDIVMIGLMMALALLGGCGGQDAGTSALLKRAAADDAMASAHDPCTLLSAGEAEPYVGTLVSPPYRSSDGAADARGDECMYRGNDGRQLTVRPDWSGGGTAADATVQGAVNALGTALGRSGGAGMDTMAHRVMKAETTGPWDQATWIPGGSLLASKGELSAQVDVSGASGKESDAVALATIIMPRFAHPLHYDGAKAVALAPKPRSHPANACDLLSRADVEAAIGPLDGTPTSESPETSCAWRVATQQGERTYTVEFLWQGGAKNYQMLKHSMATVGGVMGLPSTSPMDTMKPPPQMQAAIGGLMKMMGSGSAEGGQSAAPGAAATIGFQTDTTLRGPWDNAALLHGTQLIAVRRDVFVGMDLQSADYEKAKALLAAICSRL